MADRRVHASEETLEVVRYERSGKWRVECARDSLPKEGYYVRVRDAAAEALKIEARGGTIHYGLPGGSMFDRIVRGKA